MDLQQLIIEALNELRGMWRYRWYMVIVTWTIAISGWFFVYNMPDKYEASAKVLVDTSSLLPTLTKGLTASENVLDEVQIVYRALLTRPNLEEVARQTDLDLRAETQQEKENLITKLQKLVTVKGGRDKIFTISYQDQSREKATEVVAALLNTFVESSLGAQGDDAAMTERAIRSEIDDHERRLIEAESELAEFKKRNIGYMPDDGADYYTRLQAALASVEGTQREIQQLQQRRDEISRQLQGEVSMIESSANSAQALATCSKAANINVLRGQLASLQVDFTEKHPRIVMLNETIARLEAECREELASVGGRLPSQGASGGSGEINSVYQNLRLSWSNAEVDLASLQAQLRSEQQQVNRLRADVDKIADVETELKRLNRDYAVVEGRHQELLARWETLQSKKRLDPVTDTVQFNVLEPPFALAKPVAPNRPLLLAAVVVLALGAGAAVTVGLNQLKPVFFSGRTLERVAGLPVLGSVSMIMSEKKVAARRRSSIAWAVANVAVVVTAVVAILLANPISAVVRDLTGSGF